MLNTPCARNGMVTSPHHLASQAGLQVLRDGGTAVEAAVAVAACLAVVYPHMTSIGGDSFWLIAEPDADPIAIDACGAAGVRVDTALYHRHNFSAIPFRGSLASNTVAGAISGWDAALKISAKWKSPLPLSRLLRDAIDYAKRGFFITNNQREGTAKRFSELAGLHGFAKTYLVDGKVPSRGDILVQERLATALIVFIAVPSAARLPRISKQLARRSSLRILKRTTPSSRRRFRWMSPARASSTCRRRHRGFRP